MAHYQYVPAWIDDAAAGHVHAAAWSRTKGVVLFLISLCLATGLLQGALYLHRAALANAASPLDSAGSMSYAASSRRKGQEPISRGELPYEGELAAVFEEDFPASAALVLQAPPELPVLPDIPISPESGEAAAQRVRRPEARVTDARKKELQRLRRQAAQEGHRQDAQVAGQ